jgi:hypothetical protein
MRHFIDNIIIPDSFIQFLKYVEEETDTFLDPYERVRKITSLLNDLSPTIINQYFNFEDTNWDYTPELFYRNIPFELTPFSYSNVGGINYSWVILAPELDQDEYPCVIYDPNEEEVSWIGDDTKQAFASILIGLPKMWKKMNINARLSSPKNIEIVSLLKILDINIEICSYSFLNKLDFSLKPTIPDGWKYYKTYDGIGVLAKNEYFSGNEVYLKNEEISTYLSESEKALKNNYPASALIILKNARYEYPENIEVIDLMIESYKSLGRDMHINRINLWKDKH